MIKNLITSLIVIAVLVGLYYVISPYQECMREHPDGYAKASMRSNCSLVTDW